MTTTDGRAAQGGTTETNNNSEANGPDSGISNARVASRGARRWHHWKQWTHWERAIAVVSLLATILGAIFGGFALLEPDGEEARAMPTIDTSEFDVPYCAELSGSAPAREGKKLLVAVHFEDGYHYLEEAKRTGDRWHNRHKVGSPEQIGLRFHVSVFYLDTAYGDYLLSIEGRGVGKESEGDPKGYVVFPGIPPGAEDVVTKQLIRDNKPGPKDCG